MQHNVYPILLSFDLEEFDLPTEYGVGIALSDQIAITTEGLQTLLDTLSRYAIKATFYTTVRYAIHQSAWIQKLIEAGHELASHGLHHGTCDKTDYGASREKLQQQFHVPVHGFRMPRMKQVDIHALAQAGYAYHSSLHPTCIPGRYCHLRAARGVTTQQHILHIPPSVTPRWRIPLFWLSFHHLPQKMYMHLCKQTLEHDGYLHLYFHPWEWASWPQKLKKRMPRYLHLQNGMQMQKRFEQWIDFMLMQPIQWTTTHAWMVANFHASDHHGS